MSDIQIGNNSLPPGSVPNVSGSPGNSGDGINYPYDPNGITPNFWINWSDPNLTVAQIEQQYEGLMDWLKENPGSCYNGSVLLLQFTTDIGEHLSDPRFAGSNLAQFVSNQFTSGGGRYYLQDVIQLAAYGCAVSSGSLQTGISDAQMFLQAIADATSGVVGAGDIFNKMNSEANQDLGTIAAWCNAHWQTFPGSPGGVWVDDESISTDPNAPISGQQPILNFSQFADDCTFYLGSIISPSTGSNSSVGSAIDGMYGVSIQEIYEQYKGNPWLIMYFLLANMMTGRDADQGRAVNGYSGLLTSIKGANALVAKMIAELNSGTFSAKDFYASLNQLKELVGKNPSLTNIYQQLQQDFNQINSQTPPSGTITTGSSYQVPTSGYYNLPPGSYTINGKTYVIYAGQDNAIYIPANTPVTINSIAAPGTVDTLTFGQLAAMGDYSAIDTAMNGTPTNPGGVGWNSTVKGTMVSSLTAVTTALNSQSAAINQEMSQITQDMQAIENLIKQMFSSETSVSQTFVKNVQSILS